MNFQSNTVPGIPLGTKQEPIYINPDPYGVFTTVYAPIPTGTDSLILAVPPANFCWRIRSMAIWAPTNAQSATLVGLGVGTNTAITAYIFAFFSQTTGVSQTWTADVIIAQALWLHNTTAVTASYGVMYRQEPIPV